MLRLTLSLRCPHTVLGVHRDASRQEIKQAFQSLAKRHHPDKGGDSEEFAKVRKAFEEMMLGGKKTKQNDGEGDYTGPDDEAWQAYPRGGQYTSRATWAEPGVRVSEAQGAESGFWSSWFLKVAILTVFWFLMYLGMKEDRDEDGLTWLDRPHPAVLAVQCIGSRLSLGQRLELEKRIIKSSETTPAHLKMGPGVKIEGIGFLNYSTNTVVRSQEFQREVLFASKPKQVARWKVRKDVVKKSGVPPVRPPVDAVPAIDRSTERYENKIRELEEKLKALEEARE